MLLAQHSGLGGRLCDESDIVAVLTMQNLAKFELKDSISSIFCFKKSLLRMGSEG
jgi:hypothetical protein